MTIQLCSAQITTTLAQSILVPPNSTVSYVAGLGSPTGVGLQAIFNYVASGATSLDAFVQTSLDQGATWWDIANFHFLLASKNAYQNVSNKEVNATAALAFFSLTVDTSINGCIGDRLRVGVNSVGTYGPGTTLAVFANPRY